MDNMTLYAGWKKTPHNISVYQLGNGSARADAAQAGEGDIVNLYAVPGTGKRLYEMAR